MRTRIILTIGTNELPCLVAGRRLYEVYRERDGGAPGFLAVFSDRVKEHKDRLKEALESKLFGAGRFDDQQWAEVVVAPYEPRDIFRRVSEQIAREQTTALYHLHHTGGTAAMGVHTLEALLEKPDRRFDVHTSYLDAQGRRLRSRELDGFPLDERRYWLLSVPELVRLRGWEPEFTVSGGKKHGEQRGLRQLLTADDLPAEPPKDPKQFEAFVGGWLQRAVEDLTPAEGRPGVAVYTGHVAREKSAARDFEVDVVTVLGYELLHISCTTSAKGTQVKEKALSAWHRARQIGGDQARVLVACAMDAQSRDKQQDPAVLESNLALEIGTTERPVQIWGLHKMRRLREELVKYLSDTKDGLGWKVS